MKPLFIALCALLFAAGFARADGSLDPIGTAITGKAFDPKFPAVIESVWIYDGAKPGGKLLGIARASLPDKGFSLSIPATLKDGKTHTIYAYRANSEMLSPARQYPSGPAPTLIESSFDVGALAYQLRITSDLSQYASFAVLIKDEVVYSQGPALGVIEWPTPQGYGCSAPCGITHFVNTAKTGSAVRVVAQVDGYKVFQLWLNGGKIFPK